MVQTSDPAEEEKQFSEVHSGAKNMLKASMPTTSMGKLDELDLQWVMKTTFPQASMPPPPAVVKPSFLYDAAKLLSHVPATAHKVLAARVI